MSETAFPAGVDTFPSEATMANPSNSFANVDGASTPHSSLFRKAASAVTEIEERLIGLWYNVKEYGAVGNGTTDDTTAISNTINAAVTAGGGTVWFPAGIYKTTAKKVIVSQTPTLGVATGLRLKGAGMLATKVLYEPSASGFAFEIGDGAASKIAGNVVIEDMTIQVNNSTASGALKFVDNCSFCTVRNVQLYGNGPTNGDGILLAGQTVANSDHLFERLTVRNFNNCIHLSGFANSNVFEEIWMGVCTVGLLFDAAGSDTLAGNQNVFTHVEINGNTGTGLKMDDTAVRNTFINLITDGPTISATLTATCINNTFIGCVIPIASTTLTGAAATTNTWVACPSRSTDAIAQELRLGDTRFFRSATTTVTLGSGNDGFGAGNLSVIGGVTGESLRLKDTSRNNEWTIALGGVSTDSFDIVRQGASNRAISITNADALKVSYTGGSVGFMGATPTTRPSITGSRGGNAALASLLTGLANLGLVTDNTTA